jgi:hypothetical protein
MPWLNRAIVRCLAVSVPAAALLVACDQANPPTTPMDGVVPEFGVGVGTLPGKVTGGGQINITVNDVAGTATFGFNARRETLDGPVSGHLNYVNHVTGVHLNCEVETGGLITPAGDEDGSASFGSYECTPNSTFSNFMITVVDDDEPGRNDVFTITYHDDDDPSIVFVDGVLGPIRSGNIQVHKTQEPVGGSE